jgi:hypothetical protein
MVHVRTVSSAFHARVIAARLGADGIVTQLRGNMGSFPAFGQVSVWVNEADAETAAELLMADEVEAAFAPHPDDEEPSASRRVVFLGLNRRQLAATAALASMVLGGVIGHLLG